MVNLTPRYLVILRRYSGKIFFFLMCMCEYPTSVYVYLSTAYMPGALRD